MCIKIVQKSAQQIKVNLESKQDSTIRTGHFAETVAWVYLDGVIGPSADTSSVSDCMCRVPDNQSSLLQQYSHGTGCHHSHTEVDH